jgi:hypothetical protein
MPKQTLFQVRSRLSISHAGGLRVNVVFQLEDPSLFHERSLLNGEWVQSQSREVFDIEGAALNGLFLKKNGLS